MMDFTETESGTSKNRKRLGTDGVARDAAFIFGVAQLMCGFGAIIIGVVAALTHNCISLHGSGFWGGGFFLAAGICGIICRQKPDSLSVGFLLVFSIVSTLLAAVIIVLAGLGVAGNRGEEQCMPAIGSLLIALAIIEALCALACSLIGWKAICSEWCKVSSKRYDYSVALQSSSRDAAHGVGSKMQCKPSYFPVDVSVQLSLRTCRDQATCVMSTWTGSDDQDGRRTNYSIISSGRRSRQPSYPNPQRITEVSRVSNESSRIPQSHRRDGYTYHHGTGVAPTQQPLHKDQRTLGAGHGQTSGSVVAEPDHPQPTLLELSKYSYAAQVRESLRRSKERTPGSPCQQDEDPEV